MCGTDGAPQDVDPDSCNVFTQTGCFAGQKCTWILDSALYGEVGCAADGSGGAGQPCTFGPDGSHGFDNCAKGEVCSGGTCKPICDLDNGTSCGAAYDCVVDPGSAFHVLGGIFIAGVCTPHCDPLDDNDALGSGTRSGSSCGSNEGCYGFPGTTPTYLCRAELNPTLVHRSQCTVADGCATAQVLVNGCAQGYIPLFDDETGSSSLVCMAYCRPADCWLGNCPDNALRGALPHDCSTASARGTFELASAGGSNGEQCVYSWVFEVDALGNYTPSPTGDSIGFCIDHSKYTYMDGDGSDAVWPRCDTLPIGSGFDAVYFGCVSTTTAAANGHSFAQPQLTLHAR